MSTSSLEGAEPLPQSGDCYCPSCGEVLSIRYVFRGDETTARCSDCGVFIGRDGWSCREINKCLKLENLPTFQQSRVVPQQLPQLNASDVDPPKARAVNGGSSGRKRPGGASSVNLEVRIVRVHRLICDGLGPGLLPPTAQLIESFLWTLLAWRDLTVSDETRFVVSMIRTGRILMRKRDEVDSDQAFIKSWTNYLMCKCIDDQTGTAPKPHFPLFVGFVWNLVKRMLARRDSSFFYSLLQSKRYWPQLGQEKEFAAIQDAKRRLCFPRLSKMSDEVKQEIFRTSSKVFEHLPVPTKLAPSSSACYQASVRDGGAYSLFEKMGNLDEHSVRAIGLLPTAVWAHEEWKRSTFDVADKEASGIFLGQRTSKCTIQVIPEPSKFRIISKGDGFLYTRLQPLQGALLSKWKTRPESTMVGEIDDKVARLAKSPEPFFCSGDYQAATDTLDLRATIMAIAAVAELTDSSAGLLAMGPSELVFPDGVELPQINGQLMGHPLSFPLLCVINLACYRVAVQRFCVKHQMSKSERQRLLTQVLVNGDDILFKTTMDMFQIWCETVSEVGFILSPGKNYLSANFATINSRLYEIRGEGNGVVCRRRGYINLKLIKGFSLKTGESAATPDQIGKDVSDMCRFCPKAIPTIPACFKRFKPRTWVPNWYIPVTLGGYGVDPVYAPDELRITREQRLMAACFRNEQLSLYRSIARSSKNELFPGKAIDLGFSWMTAVEASHFMMEHENRSTLQDWTGRLSEIMYAMYGKPNPEDFTVQMERLRRTRGIKPVTIAWLIRHWSDELVPSAAPDVPAPGVLAY